MRWIQGPYSCVGPILWCCVVLCNINNKSARYVWLPRLIGRASVFHQGECVFKPSASHDVFYSFKDVWKMQKMRQQYCCSERCMHCAMWCVLATAGCPLFCFPMFAENSLGCAFLPPVSRLTFYLTRTYSKCCNIYWIMPELEINYLLFAVYCLQKIPHIL